MSTDQVQTASRTEWNRIALVLFVGVVAAFHVGKVPSALPDIRLDLGIGMVSAGWIVSVYTGTAVVFALAAGVLADRVGHRNTLLGGLLLLAAGSAAGSAMDTQPALVAMRLVEGVGFVLIVVSAPSLILRATAPKDRSISLGIWAAFMPIGVTGMLVIAPFVLTQFGWRGLWQLNAAIPLAAFLVVLVMLRRPAASSAPRQPIGRIWSDLKITVARPGPWVLSLSFAAFGLQYATLTSWLPTFMIEVQGRTTAQAATMTAIVVSLTAVGAFGAGWILGRGVPRWILLAVCGASMGPLGLATFSPGLPGGPGILRRPRSFAGGRVDPRRDSGQHARPRPEPRPDRRHQRNTAARRQFWTAPGPASIRGRRIWSGRLVGGRRGFSYCRICFAFACPRDPAYRAGYGHTACA